MTAIIHNYYVVHERYTVHLSGFSTLETFSCLLSQEYEITVIIYDYNIDCVQEVYCSPQLTCNYSSTDVNLEYKYGPLSSRYDSWFED